MIIKIPSRFKVGEWVYEVKKTRHSKSKQLVLIIHRVKITNIHKSYIPGVEWAIRYVDAYIQHIEDFFETWIFRHGGEMNGDFYCTKFSEVQKHVAELLEIWGLKSEKS